MDAVDHAELVELRRRAYGPGRDVAAGDLDRLRTLEERAVAASTAADAGPAAESEAEPVAGTDARADPDPGAGPALAAPGDRPDGEPTSGPRTSARRRRRVGVLWAASLAAAVAGTAVLGSTLAAPPGREVAVVRLDPDLPLPEHMRDWFGGAETGSAPFHGLTVVRLANDMSAFPDRGRTCLSIQPARAAMGTTEGGGCSAGRFGASAQLVVNFGAPEELREVYPVGTALLFDLRGDSVHVRADDLARLPTPASAR